MSILYIIGNGFDLAQGLKSRYKDFYPYYLERKSPNKAVQLLKDEINSNIEDWADMELALGKFTEKVGSESLMEELYYNLSDELTAYLQTEIKKKKFAQSNKILNDLFEPYRYLEPMDQRTYQDHFRRLSDGDKTSITFNIITLNYTDTIEKLTGYPQESSKTYNRLYYVVKNICHRHGRLGDTILLGVDNDKQIANESFKQNRSVIDYLVKPASITSMRSDNDMLCKSMIKDAEIIILFGVSLGETDACLWRDVVKTLDRNNPALLVYFHHSLESIPPTRKQLLGRKEEEVRRFLYQRLGVPEKHQSDRNILVGYNKGIFVDKKAAETNTDLSS